MPRFNSFDIVTRASSVLRRIAKIKLHHDGSIYVFFPSFARTDGIVGRALLRAGQRGPSSVDLSENGRVTSHLVKYAHHTDGEAHFSQDGKVKTDVRRKSVPLPEQRGHLFTIQLQNIESFKILSDSRKNQLTIDLPDNVRALKIVAARYPLSDINFPEGFVEGALPTALKTSDGRVRPVLLVAPQNGKPFDDVALLITAQETTWLSDDKAPSLLFLGGFDHYSTVMNSAVDSEFLAFLYPCSDHEELKNRIGSIDLSTDTSTRLY